MTGNYSTDELAELSDKSAEINFAFIFGTCNNRAKKGELDF